MLREYYNKILQRNSISRFSWVSRPEGKRVGQNCKGDEGQQRAAREPQGDQLKRHTQHTGKNAGKTTEIIARQDSVKSDLVVRNT